MKKSLLPVLCCGCALLVSSCATGYQKLSALSISGGYADKDLGRDVYRVTFSANGYTSRETAQCFWLYRCAQLTLEKGSDGFEIISSIQLTELKTPEEFLSGGARVKPAVYTYIPMYMPMDESNKPLIEADIHLLKAPLDAQPPKIFDARKLKDALEPFVADPIKSGGNVKAHIHEYLLPEGKIPPADKKA